MLTSRVPGCFLKAQRVSSARERIREGIQGAVKSRWPEFQARRLPGYRYCFSRKLEADPLSLFQHLIVRHHRRKRELQAWWCLSFFPVFHLGELPRGFQVSSDLSRQPLGSDIGSLLESLPRAEALENLQESLEKDNPVPMYLWSLFKGLKSVEIPPAYRAGCRELVSLEGFSMSEPTEVRMGAFLQDFIPEEAESEAGSFSLESSRAREKLADFQLVNPKNFFLHLVAAGIAGGAPEVRVSVDSDDVVVEFEGEPLAKTALEDLFSGLLSGRVSSQQRELAVALNAALALEPKLLRAESWHNGSGSRLCLENGEERLVSLSDSPLSHGGSGHRVAFRDRPSLEVVKRLLRSVSREHPERDVLRERCAYASVPILWNGKSDCRRLPEEGVLAYQRWMHPEHPLPALSLSSAWGEEKSSPVEASVHILLGPEAGVHWQLNGLLYPGPVQVESFGLWVLVVDNKAGRDLSFSALNRDARTEQLAGFVRAKCESFAESLLQRYARLGEEERESWAQAMQSLGLQGLTEVWKLPVFRQVAGGLVDRTFILNQKAVLASERDFAQGLRDGSLSFVLSEPVREDVFAESRVLDVTVALEQVETYHRRREEWLSATSPVSLADRGEGRPTREFHSLGVEGCFALLERPELSQEVEFYQENRLLASEALEDFPAGLRVVLQAPGLDRDWSWSCLEKNVAYDLALRAARRGLAEFYESLMDETGDDVSDYLLNYLLFLKEQGKGWERYSRRVRFRTLAGGEVTLHQLTQEVPWADIALRAHDFQDSFQASVQRRVEIFKGALSKVSLSWPQLYRVGKLVRDWESSTGA